MSENTPDYSQLSLDDLRLVLAPGIAEAATFDGWTLAAVYAAAARLGISGDVARLAFPGKNPAMAMIAAWIAAIDARMARELPTETLVAMPIRQRIRRLVTFRLDAVGQAEEALRRALAIMAMPRNVAQSLALGWHSADGMWRLAGDTATDFSHYSKRATLSAIYASTLLIFVDDHSEAKAETLAFLDRRIDDVMRFEKAKAGWRRSGTDYFSPARFLGRLRYPPR
ncbi:MAG: COQ9 family protein [Pseudomonadota bacterium]|nr:COQ9 family protein [Pseudomonadota bacterium]